MRMLKFLAAVVPLLALACLLLFGAHPAYSYLPALAAPTVRVHWPALPVSWNLNPNITGSGITGARSVADVIQASFATWSAAPNTFASANRGADTSVTSEANSSGLNLICFICAGDFSKDKQTLAVTNFTFDNTTGNMSKADILFNPADDFNTQPGFTNSLQTVATHEIGHFFGLDHSGIAAAVMFPYSPTIIAREALSSDDVAGISVLYPASPTVPVGTIQGTVRLNNGAVFGAHVFAESTTASSGYGGSIRKSAIGTLTASDGTYTINGLPADTYVITAEPLDGPVTNSDISSYSTVFRQTVVQTNFTTRQH